MPLPANLAAARRLAADALAAGALRTAHALGHRGLARADQHAERLVTRTDQLTTVEDQLVAARARLDQAEAAARDAAAAQHAAKAETQRAYQVARAEYSDRLAEAHARTGRAMDDNAAVIDVLVRRGHIDAVIHGHDTADSVTRALDDPVPEGAEITRRIAEVLWQAGQNELGTAVEHAFLSQTACRHLAFVLAPVVAGWLRDTPTTTTTTSVPEGAHP